MAQLHPHPLGAAIDAVVHHEAHADAMLDGDHGEIGQTAAGAEPQFSQRHQIGVVVDNGGQPQPDARRRRKRHLAVGQDRGPEDHALGHIDKAGHLDADGREIGAGHAGLGADLVQQGFDGVEQLVQRHRAGAARDHVIGDQLAGEIDNDAGVFAVG